MWNWESLEINRLSLCGGEEGDFWAEQNLQNLLEEESAIMNHRLRKTFAQLYVANVFKLTHMYVKSHTTTVEQDKKTNIIWQALRKFNRLTVYAHML